MLVEAEVTMHMAFDRQQLSPSAIQWLKDHGVTRLLTRAGTPETALGFHACKPIQR